MDVRLIDHTHLSTVVQATRHCWGSEKKSCYPTPTDDITEKDMALLLRVGVKYNHASVLEHGVASFAINGISRAVLQELARHRIQSLSVRSTRYTLHNGLKHEMPFTGLADKERAEKYLVLPPRSEAVAEAEIAALERLRKLIIEERDSNDILKYAIPESFKTSLVSTFNLRSLRNFIQLRTDRSALWEIQDLATLMVMALPEQWKPLIEDVIS